MHPAVVCACVFHLPLIFPAPSVTLYPLVVTVQYEWERYTIAEGAGPVTLALVLDKAVSFSVTVIVNTLDLQNSSVRDAATGGLLAFCLWGNVLQVIPLLFVVDCLRQTL